MKSTASAEAGLTILLAPLQQPGGASSSPSKRLHHTLAEASVPATADPLSRPEFLNRERVRRLRAMNERSILAAPHGHAGCRRL
jgi:hypothetical protein